MELTDVRDVAGEPLLLNVEVYPDTVDLLSGIHWHAVFDRATLRDWFSHPNQPLTVQEVTWRSTVDDGVVLDVPMVFVSHRISTQDVEALRAIL